MTTPSTSAQGPLARPTPAEIEAVTGVLQAHARGDIYLDVASGPEFSRDVVALIGRLTASPSPAASPASPSGVREAALHLAFEIGYCWRGMLVGQTLEDSRAVCRTLGADIFDGLNIDASEVPGFETADIGIYHAKRAIRKALAALASDATPAPTSGSEDGGDWRPVLTEMVAAMNRYGHDIGDGDIPSAHRSLMWRAEQLLAKPASEPAGGDVREALRWVEQNLAAAKRAMKTSAEHSDGRSNFAAHDAHKHLSTIAAALSPSAGPAGEGQDWKRIAKETEARANFLAEIIRDCPEARNVWGQRIADEAADALAAHPAPATVEISDAMIDAGCAAWVKLYPAFDGEKPQPTAGDVVKAILSAALAPATEGRKS